MYDATEDARIQAMAVEARSMCANLREDVQRLRGVVERMRLCRPGEGRGVEEGGGSPRATA